jgi:hypothetical protein
MSIRLVLDADAGDSVDRCLEEMLGLANRLNVPVTISLNGVPAWAQPGDSLDFIRMRYHQMVADKAYFDGAKADAVKRASERGRGADY